MGDLTSTTPADNVVPLKRAPIDWELAVVVASELPEPVKRLLATPLRQVVASSVGAASEPASRETCDAWALRHVAWRAGELGLGVKADFGSHWREGKLAGRWGGWIGPVLGGAPVDAPSAVLRENIESVRDKLNAAVRAYYRDGKGKGRCAYGAAMNAWSVLTTAFKQMMQAEKESGLRVRSDNPALGVAPPSLPTKMTRKSVRCARIPLRAP